jgi:hypothetical protein
MLDALLVQVLNENRGVLAVVDAHYLNQYSYPNRNSLHAIIVYNYLMDSSEAHQVGYVGLDSNCPGKNVVWRLTEFHSAVENTRTENGPPVVLITDHPVPERPGFERCKYRKINQERAVPVP